MRSNLGFIKQRIAENLDESGTDIVLTWNEWPSGSTVSGIDQSRSGTPTRATQTVKGFPHFIQAANTSAVRQFNECEVGDCIVDLDPAVILEGRDGLEFTIDGRIWVPKEVSARLGKSWDVVMHGERLFRTALLKLKL